MKLDTNRLQEENIRLREYAEKLEQLVLDKSCSECDYCRYRKVVTFPTIDYFIKTKRFPSE